MSVTLVKSPHFDDIVAAENAGREGRDGVATGSAAEDSGMSGLRGPRHYVGGGGPGSRCAPIQTEAEVTGVTHDLPGTSNVSSHVFTVVRVLQHLAHAHLVLIRSALQVASAQRFHCHGAPQHSASLGVD